MVPYSKAYNRLQLQYLLRLNNGTYVALGKYDSNVAIVRFNETGEILQNEHYSLGRTYIDVVIATDDGGFAMVTRRGLRFIKFDAEGNITFKRDLSDHRHQIFNYSIAKTDNGYLIGSSIGKDAQMQLLQIDKEGRKIEVHRYAKKGVRLHPKFLVKSPSDDYLLAVTTDIYEPWIVHVKANGIIETDLNDPTKYRAAPLTQNEIEPSSPTGDQLPAHTPLDKKKPTAIKTVMVKTSSSLGGAIRKMIPSKDGKRVYAITSATGFKVFQKEPDGQWVEASSIRRSLSKLIIKPNYIGPVDGKPPKYGTPYDYDTPFDLWIDKAETTAYISDVVHGFYAVDITDSAHPKVRYSAPDLKLHYFILSKDERAILFYAEGRFQRLSLQDIEHKQKKLSYNDSDGQHFIASLNNREKVVISERNFLLLYESSSGKFIAQQNLGTNAYISKIFTDGKYHIAVKSRRGETTVLELDKNGVFQEITTIHNEQFVHDIVLLPKKERLCSADKEGVLCTSYKDPFNPKPLIRYRNKALNGAYELTLDATKEKLIIVFYHGGLGEAPIDP